MNLRILKKLSKRAAPLLILLGSQREQFKTVCGEWHDIPLIGARKHWDRVSCQPGYRPRNDWLIARGMEIIFTTRKGRTILMRPPREPLKGTIMVVSMSGGEEPDWSEETAWSALQGMVLDHFTAEECFAAWANWDGEGQPPVWRFTRPLKTPSDVFKAAEEILCEQRVRQLEAIEAFSSAVAEIGGSL